jgi:hypothetical protein
MRGDGRPRLERALDVPERMLLRLSGSANGRIVVRGLFGFLKQVVRSRALGLGRRRGLTPRRTS